MPGRHVAQNRWSHPARPDISNAGQWDAHAAAGIPCAASTSGKTGTTSQREALQQLLSVVSHDGGSRGQGSSDCRQPSARVESNV
jgi:hypothetical protein